MKLLPIEFDEEELGAAAEANVLMNYEPNETEALDMIIPNTLQACFTGHLWRQLPVKRCQNAGNGFCNEQCRGYDQ